MALQPLNTSNSLGTNFNQVNDIVSQLNNEQTVKIFKDNTGTRRVLMGKGANNFYGLKVSKDGVDVYTATDDQLVFNSSQDVFKIVKVINFSIVQPANSSSTYNKPHGLSYIPAIMPFLAAGLGIFRPLPTSTSLIRDDTAGNVYNTTWVDAQADATNITIRFFNATSAAVGNYNFKVFVLQETAQ